MANAMFDKALEGLWSGSFNWTGDTYKVVLVNHATDTPNTSTDQYLSDILAGARVATSTALVNPTITAGVIKANDITLTSVSGSVVDSISVFKDTGVESTSPLLAYIDTTTDSSLPFTPNGGDVTIQWNAAGIVSIA